MSVALDSIKIEIRFLLDLLLSKYSQKAAINPANGAIYLSVNFDFFLNEHNINLYVRLIMPKTIENLNASLLHYLVKRYFHNFVIVFAFIIFFKLNKTLKKYFEMNDPTKTLNAL